jgi:hypothetical protein
VKNKLYWGFGRFLQSDILKEQNWVCFLLQVRVGHIYSAASTVLSLKSTVSNEPNRVDVSRSLSLFSPEGEKRFSFQNAAFFRISHDKKVQRILRFEFFTAVTMIMPPSGM